MKGDRGLLARLEEYALLRDDGLTQYQAADRMRISESTRHRYERWYRKQRDLPSGPAWFSAEWYAKTLPFFGKEHGQPL